LAWAIGLLGYYRGWIEGFGQQAKLLFQLLQKDNRFEWTELQQVAFDDLKKCLLTAPILASPNDEGKFVLDTDASTAAGAVLSQYQGDVLRVVAYASRTFRGPETRYSTNQRELAAVIFGLKNFRQYLLGRDFTLRTDHSALKYLMTTKDVGPIQGRHLDFLAQFRGMEIVHRSGASHGNCDGLSRRPPNEITTDSTTDMQSAAAATEITDVQHVNIVIPTTNENEHVFSSLLEGTSRCTKRSAWVQRKRAGQLRRSAVTDIRTRLMRLAMGDTRH